MEKAKKNIIVFKANFCGAEPHLQNPKGLMSWFAIPFKQDSADFNDAVITATPSSVLVVISSNYSPDQAIDFCKRCVEAVNERAYQEGLYGPSCATEVLTVHISIALNFNDRGRPFEQFSVVCGEGCGAEIINEVITSAFFFERTPELIRDAKLEMGFLAYIKKDGEMKEYKIPQEISELSEFLDKNKTLFIHSLISRYRIEEQIVSVAVHNNSFVALVRTEGIFPSLSMITRPFTYLPVIPLPFEIRYNNPYGLGTAHCLSFAMTDRFGGFNGLKYTYGEVYDVFNDPGWETVRKGIEMDVYAQGWRKFSFVRK